MDPNIVTSLATVATALIVWGASTTAQSRQAKREGRQAEHNQLRLAVEEVLATSMTFSSRARQWNGISTILSSIGGTVNAITRSTQPLDLLALFEVMTRDSEALDRAVARVWLTSREPRAIRLANDVAIAAGNVVDAVGAPRPKTLRSRLTRPITGFTYGDPETIQTAINQLMQTRKALAEHARASIGLPAVDIWDAPSTPDNEDHHEVPERYPRPQ